MNEKKRLANCILVALSLIILIMGARIFAPFLKPAAWAIIIVLFLYPVYSRLNSILKDRRGLSAALMCILVITFVIIPAFLLSSALAEEAIKLYTHLREVVETSKATEITERLYWLPKYKEALAKYFPTIRFEAKDVLSATLGRVGEFLVQEGTVIIKNFLQFLIHLVFTIVIIYYLFKDGRQFLSAVKELLPLSPIEAETFAIRIYEVLIATVRGSFFTGLIQGILGGMILWFLGFSAPVLWGTLMGIATFIPLLGTSVIWIPATVYLLLEGSIAKALILLAFSVLIISQVDYFLRPLLISGRAKLHNLLLFFSIIGGLWTFGLIGIFLGPILVSLAAGILEIYRLKVLERGV